MCLMIHTFGVLTRNSHGVCPLHTRLDRKLAHGLCCASLLAGSQLHRRVAPERTLTTQLGRVQRPDLGSTHPGVPNGRIWTDHDMGLGQPSQKSRAWPGSGSTALGDQRASIGMTSRLTGPVKSWRGRPILYSGSANISLSWAIQPTVRARAKMPVKRLTGIPIARCTMPE